MYNYNLATKINYLSGRRINLDKLLIENICEKYPIGDIVSYEKVKSGNTAETFLINSKSKKWQNYIEHLFIHILKISLK